MRLFINELRKIWDLRILAALAVLAIPFGIVFLIGLTESYASLTHYGNFGEYQNEMYAKYGATLEPEELADFDIDAVRAAVIAEGDAIISQNQVFADNAITNYGEYIEFRDNLGNNWNEFTAQERERVSAAQNEMMAAFTGGSDSMDAWHHSVVFRVQQLDALKYYYVDYGGRIAYIRNDNRPVVVSVLEEIAQAGNGNLVSDYLSVIFSQYTVSVGIFAIISIVLLVAPMIVTDRARGINMLQYSSKAGRKTFRIQLAATLTSAAVLGIALCAASFIPWLSTNASQYWNDGLRQLGSWGIFLYDVTFGQYVFLLYGTVVALCVAASGLAFILARFSDSVVSLMLKTVPVAAALAGLAYCALYMALRAENLIFTQIFRGSVVAPELWACLLIIMAAVCAACVVARRERRVDLV
jgi:hypothetical protein